jgi:hypothetical protein
MALGHSGNVASTAWIGKLLLLVVLVLGGARDDSGGGGMGRSREEGDDREA